MGGCCARRRVPERCEASLADNRAESAALSAQTPPQGQCRGVQSEATAEGRRARRTGPQALFVGSLAQKRSFFDKLQNILPV